MKHKTSCWWSYNDGGRASSGYKGHTGDCVVRAIAIATMQPYKTVYDELFAMQKEKALNGEIKGMGKHSKHYSVRNGVHRSVYQPYLEERGWKWVPTMGIGTGCKVHLNAEELPSGRIIVRLSKHIAAVSDGIILDTYDCTRGGKRCVYGYFTKGK